MNTKDKLRLVMAIHQRTTKLELITERLNKFTMRLEESIALDNKADNLHHELEAEAELVQDELKELDKELQ